MIILKPLYLLLIILLIPYLYITIKKRINKNKNHILINSILSEKRSDKFFILLIFRALSILFLILSLAEIKLLLPAGTNNVLMLFDISASISNAEKEKAKSSIIEYLRKQKNNTKYSFILFAEEPKILTLNSTAAKTIQVIEDNVFETDRSDETDLTKAFNLAKEILKKSYGNKSIMLFSDGKDTKGFSDIDFTNIPVYIYPFGTESSAVTSIELEIPENAAKNEKFIVLLTLESRANYESRVDLKLNDKIYFRKMLNIKKGNNTFPLELVIAENGVFKISAEVSLSNQLYEAEGIINITGEKKILLIDNKNNSYFFRSITQAGINTEKIAPEELPELSSLLLGFNTIVLDNISAKSFTERQMDSLKNYASAGGSILVIGGDKSLGKGEYYSTKLEDILPVNTDTRKRMLFNKTSILFIIDQSGSMIETVSGLTKQEIAMQGVKESIKELKVFDEVGILTFDVKPYWILPFTEMKEKDKIISSLTKIRRGGGTDITVALAEAIKAFTKPKQFQKHIILLTDGLSFGENFKELSDKLKNLDVTISTMGFGEEVNEELLKNLSEWTNGVYYRVNLDDVPKIMNKETVRITQDIVQEGSFTLKSKINSQIFDGMEDIPNINGYIRIKPKNFSEVYLETDKEDPILAFWNYGNGKTAVFASDSGERWLTSWSSKKEYNIFWSNILRFLSKEKNNDPLNTNIILNNKNADIIVDALTEDKELKTGLSLTGYNSSADETFYFKETLSGRYEANINLTKPGLNVIEVHDHQNGNFKILNIWNSSNFEKAQNGTNKKILNQIIKTSGGSALNDGKLPIIKTKFSFNPVSLNYFLIILSVIFFIIELGYRSISFGQFKMIKIIFENYIKVQKFIFGKLQNKKEIYRDSMIYDKYDITFDSHKYLADKLRKKL